MVMGRFACAHAPVYVRIPKWMNMPNRRSTYARWRSSSAIATVAPPMPGAPPVAAPPRPPMPPVGVTLPPAPLCPPLAGAPPAPPLSEAPALPPPPETPPLVVGAAPPVLATPPLPRAPPEPGAPPLPEGRPPLPDGWPPFDAQPLPATTAATTKHELRNETRMRLDIDVLDVPAARPPVGCPTIAFVRLLLRPAAARATVRLAGGGCGDRAPRAH